MVNLQTGSDTSTPSVRADPRSKQRRKAGPRRGVPFDRRRREGRRAKELAALFSERLGDASRDATLQIAIGRAAELVAYAESLRARALRGEDVPPDDVVRTERLANLAMRALHLDRAAAPRGPTLAEYLASKAGGS
jgi:hypothetical protein